MVTTEQQLRKSYPDQVENWGTWVFVLDRGRIVMTQENPTGCAWGYGPSTINGHKVEWTYTDSKGTPSSFPHNQPGEHFVFGWSIYGDTVTLTAVPNEVSPGVLMYPWHRLSTRPDMTRLSKHCSPPAQATAR